MKILNIPLSQEEYDALRAVKQNLTWREFLMSSVEYDKIENKNGN